MPTKGVNQERTPHEAWTGEKPDVSKFRVFGCQCWTAVNRAHPAKLADRAREGVFLGFPDNQKGSLIYIPATKRIVVSKDVIFDEQVFPFRSSQKQESFPQEHETIEVEEIGTEAYIADTPRLEEADEEVLRELRTVTEVQEIHQRALCQTYHMTCQSQVMTWHLMVSRNLNLTLPPEQDMVAPSRPPTSFG